MAADTSRPGLTAAAGPGPEVSPVENAWRIHASLVEWTGRVDTKAAFALSLESGTLAGTAALASGDHGLLDLSDPGGIALLWTGVGLLALSALLAVAVVVPRVTSVRDDPGGRSDFTYFGHLRRWDPEELADTLRTQDPLLSLSRQLVVMARVAWIKHRMVKSSLTVAVAGACITASACLLR